MRLLALLLVLWLTACVTRGTHEEIVGALEAEKAVLQTRVTDLERSNRSLDAERVELIDQLEDLRQAREVLERDVAKLQRSKELLTEHLRAREQSVEELSKLSSTYRGLVNELEAEVSSGQIEIEQLREGIRLNLAQDILFPSGSVELDPVGAKVLRHVSDQLKKINHRIEVQGHSDDVPLSSRLAQRYGSNWELAGARAAQVVRLLESEGVDPHRLSSVSFGQWAPVRSNDTPEGRAYNRRIEIRLIPVADAAESPPEASPEPADS